MIDKNAELEFQNKELRDRVAGLEMLINQKDMKIRAIVEQVKELRELVKKTKTEWIKRNKDIK